MNILQLKNQVRAYFAEAKWAHEGYIPTIEEYMLVALVTSSSCMLTTWSFIGMGEIMTKEAFDWVFMLYLYKYIYIYCWLKNKV